LTCSGDVKRKAELWSLALRLQLFEIHGPCDRAPAIGPEVSHRSEAHAQRRPPISGEPAAAV